MSQTPEQIAAGLTDAQRKALLTNLPDEILIANPSVARSLAISGLLSANRTRLGQQVRAILKEQKP
jgi:hypothetical protein